MFRIRELHADILSASYVFCKRHLFSNSASSRGGHVSEVADTASGPSVVFLSFYSHKTSNRQLSMWLPGIKTTVPRVLCSCGHMMRSGQWNASSGSFQEVPLKGGIRFSSSPYFCPAGRNPGRAGTVILEPEVTLEVEAMQAEQQGRRSLGLERCDVRTSPGQLNSEAENKYLS